VDPKKKNKEREIKDNRHQERKSRQKEGGGFGVTRRDQVMGTRTPKKGPTLKREGCHVRAGKRSKERPPLKPKEETSWKGRRESPPKLRWGGGGDFEDCLTGQGTEKSNRFSREGKRGVWKK